MEIEGACFVVPGEHTPLAACLQYVHDGIHDVSDWGTFAFCVVNQEYFR